MLTHLCTKESKKTSIHSLKSTIEVDLSNNTGEDLGRENSAPFCGRERPIFFPSLREISSYDLNNWEGRLFI